MTFQNTVIFEVTAVRAQNLTLDKILLSTDIWKKVLSHLLCRNVGRSHGDLIPDEHCYQHSCLSAVSDFSVR